MLQVHRKCLDDTRVAGRHSYHTTTTTTTRIKPTKQQKIMKRMELTLSTNERNECVCTK